LGESFIIVGFELGDLEGDENRCGVGCYRKSGVIGRRCLIKGYNIKNK